MQKQAELLGLHGIQLMPPKDHEFLFLILSGVRMCREKKLILQDLWIQQLQQLFDEDSKYLTGRIIQQLGALQLTNIDFWLKIEEKYLLIVKEESAQNLVEAINGFAIVNRGSTSIIQLIQECLKVLDVPTIKTLDIVRGLFGVSLLPHEKINLDLFDEWSLEAMRRLQDERGTLTCKVIDLISLLQSFVNCTRVSQDQFDMIQSEITKHALNERNVLSLFEVYGKLLTSGDQLKFNKDLEYKIKEYLLHNYYDISLQILSQITHVLRHTDSDKQILNQLSEKIINDQRYLYNPMILKDIIRALNI